MQGAPGAAAAAAPDSPTRAAILRGRQTRSPAPGEQQPCVQLQCCNPVWHPHINNPCRSVLQDHAHNAWWGAPAAAATAAPGRPRGLSLPGKRTGRYSSLLLMSHQSSALNCMHNWRKQAGRRKHDPADVQIESEQRCWLCLWLFDLQRTEEGGCLSPKHPC